MRDYTVTRLLPVLFVMQTGWCHSQAAEPRVPLPELRSEALVDTATIQAWHERKAERGSTLAGSPGWRAYMEFLQAELQAAGVVDVVRNSWTYPRWDATDWALTVAGEPVETSGCVAYSGDTGPAGVEAPLTLYRQGAAAEEYAGRIVVFRADAKNTPLRMDDYEYVTDPGSFPEPGAFIPAEETISLTTWGQLLQAALFIRALPKTSAAGAIVVWDMPPDLASGLYTFPVPSRFDVPAVCVDRTHGPKVIAAAEQGQSATLRLDSVTEPAEVWQLIGYLPGKNYGTPEDEQILLITHTDGPSISQENGPLGVLAAVQYFGALPQVQRDKSLLVYLDCRHYMPGMEDAYEDKDWLAKNEQALEPVVAIVSMEHLGQLEFAERDGAVKPTGQVEGARLYATNHQPLVDAAIAAVQAQEYPRVLVTVSDRPGAHDKPQGRWYGLGQLANERSLPGYATMGTMGRYWTTTAGIETFDAGHFRKQVATMTQLTQWLMQTEPELWRGMME